MQGGKEAALLLDGDGLRDVETPNDGCERPSGFRRIIIVHDEHEACRLEITHSRF